MRVLFWIALLCLLALPSPPTAAEAPLGLPPTDARLNQRVVARAEGLALGELLLRLSRETGFPLRADREAAGDKVVLFGPARPLRDLLGDLAVFLGGRWERREEASGATYLLVRTPETRKLERDQVEAPDRQLEAAMDAQLRALWETPPRLALRRTDDPIREYLSDPKARLATRLYAGLTQRQRAALFRYGTLRLFHSTLTPVQQAGVQELYGPEPPERPVREGRVFAAVARRRHPPDLEFSLTRWSSGRNGIRIWPGHVLFGEATYRPVLPPPHGNPYTGAPVPENASFPDPKLVAAVPPGEWTDRLRELSEKAGVPVLADCYRIWAIPHPSALPKDGPPPANAAVRELDAFCRPEGALWWTRGHSLLFRRRDWVARRQYETPDAWLDDVTRRLARQEGVPTFGDLLRVGDLTYPQQQGLWAMEARMLEFPLSLGWPAERLAGLPELLSLLRGRFTSPARNRVRLLSYEETHRVGPSRERMTLAYAQMTPDQRGQILPFLAVQRRQLDGQPVEEFEVTLHHREPRAGKSRPQYRAVPVRIEWRVGRSGRGEYELLLPLVVPDDRRERAEVNRADSSLPQTARF